MSTEPLVFIETPDVLPPAKPQLKRQITFLKNLCRPLWQEENEPIIKQTMLTQSAEMAGVDKDEMEITKLIWKFSECTLDESGRECELSGKIEESNRSKNNTCGKVLHKSSPTSD